MQGVDALEAYFGRYVPQMALSLLVPVAVLIAVVPLDPTAAIIMAVTLPLIPVFMVLVGNGGRGVGAVAAARHRRRSAAASSTSSAGSPPCGPTAAPRPSRRSWPRPASATARETMATLRVAFLSALVLELAATLAVALVAVTVGVRLAGGGMELEAGLAVLILAPELYAPLRQLGVQFHASADGMAAAERIHEVLDQPALLAEAAQPASRCPTPAAAPIRLEGVGFAYPAREVPALRGRRPGAAARRARGGGGRRAAPARARCWPC